MTAAASRPLRIAALIATVSVAASCTLPGTTPPKPAAVSPAARDGGTITVATLPPGIIDPVAVTNEPARLVSSLLCDTLVTVDPATGELRPGLAETWMVSDGGNAIQVKLRRGVTFSDGSRVDSRAVVASFRRLVSPETASPMADLLRALAGYEEYRESVEAGDDRSTLLRGVRVIEPYSFEILLSAADRDFIRTLSHPATAPVNVAAAQRDTTASSGSPVCAGPYELDGAYEPGDEEIRLVRSPDYTARAPGYTRGGAGWAERIDFRVFSDEDAAYEAWSRGEVDVTPVPPARVAEAGAAYAASYRTGPGGQVEYIGLPQGSGSPFEDETLRQALAAAIDRDRVADEVYGGSRAPATGFLPPVVGDAHRERACSFPMPPEPPRFPMESFPLYFNDEFAHRRLAESIAAQWTEKLGVRVTPVALNWDEYLEKATTGSGFDGAFRMSWTPRTPIPVLYMAPVAHSQFIGETNLSRFSDLALDEAFDKDLARAADEGDRVLILHEIEDELCRRLPVIPIVFSETHLLVRDERLASAREDGRMIGVHGELLLRELAVREPA